MRIAVLDELMKIAVKETPKPKPRPEEVLLKVHACSICGTDLHSYKYGESEILKRLTKEARRDIKRYFSSASKLQKAIRARAFYGAITSMGGGHQIAGEVVEVGSGVTKWKVGDRVCGHALPGFAEYCTAFRVYRMPKELSYAEGSFIEPLAVAVAAVRRSRLSLGDTAVVLGGGPIGQLILQCAKAAGATVYVTEIAERRVSMARKFADEAINPKEVDAVKKVKDLTGGGPDVIFECVGKDATMRQLIEMSRPYLTSYGEQTRGIIVALYEKPWAYELFDNNAVTAKNLELIGSFGYHPYNHPMDEMKIALKLMKTRMVDIASLITAKVPLGDINDAFKALIRGEGLAIVVEPQK